MDLKIGIAQSAHVIEVELAEDADRPALKKHIAEVLADTESAVFWVEDKRGKELAVPAERIAFIQLGSDEDGRRIGFGA